MMTSEPTELTTPEASQPPAKPRPRSVVGISMGLGLFIGFLIGITHSRLFALTMFFGAALGAVVGVVIDARRRNSRRS